MRGTGRIAFALVVLSVAVHLPSLVIGYVLDDHWIVERNALVGDLSHVPEIVSKDYWSIEGSTARNLYRPATVLSFALTQAMAGARPIGHRLVNLILSGPGAGPPRSPAEGRDFRPLCPRGAGAACRDGGPVRDPPGPHRGPG